MTDIDLQNVYARFARSILKFITTVLVVAMTIRRQIPGTVLGAELYTRAAV
jgi:hypothetical protein